MRKYVAIPSLIMIASMLLAACGGNLPFEGASDPAPSIPLTPDSSEEAEIRSSDPGTFVQVEFGEPETLDPALGYDTASNEIIQNIYEPLVFYDGDRTDKFIPMLAESWDISNDGTIYTFKIRSGVKFHGGQDLTAEDVAYSFQRGLLFGGSDGPQWLLAEPFFGVGWMIARLCQPPIQMCSLPLVNGSNLRSWRMRPTSLLP